MNSPLSDISILPLTDGISKSWISSIRRRSSISFWKRQQPKTSKLHFKWDIHFSLRKSALWQTKRQVKFLYYCSLKYVCQEWGGGGQWGSIQASEPAAPGSNPQIFSDFILDVAEINELHCLVQWTLDSGCLMLIEPDGTAKKSSEIILLNSAFLSDSAIRYSLIALIDLAPRLRPTRTSTLSRVFEWTRITLKERKMCWKWPFLLLATKKQIWTLNG